MRRLRLGLACVLIALPVLAAAQTAPDPAALDLARLLMSRDPSLYDDADTARIQVRLENALLASPGACNPFVGECRSAATQVAHDFAPALRTAERARAEQVNAALLAESLSAEEMAHAAAYLRSVEGQHVFDALARLRPGDESDRRRRALERSLPAATDAVTAPALAAFRQRTRNLAAAPPR